MVEVLIKREAQLYNSFISSLFLEISKQYSLNMHILDNVYTSRY